LSSAGLSLNPTGNIDAIAKDIVLAVNYVTDVNADAHIHALLIFDTGIFCRELALDIHRAVDGAKNAGKIGKERIANGLDNSPLVGVNLTLQYLVMTG
jgi:hypothetical protein